MHHCLWNAILTVLMTRLSLPELAHQQLARQLQRGDIVVDATAGNGHDTLFLAQLVGKQGKVFAFDLQADAIRSTHQRLEQAGWLDKVELLQHSHANMQELIPEAYHGRIQSVVFNLGYLPGGDKSIITRQESTLQALHQATQILSHTGLISLLVYPGHAGGKLEHAAIKQWLQQLSSDEFTLKTQQSHHPKPTAPVLYWLQGRPKTG